MIDLSAAGLGGAVLLFLASAAIVVVAGVMLAGAGDEIATRTGLGGALVGMILLAGATSLPEIVIEASAAAAGQPDLALGDLFGSGMANMAILAVIDLMHRGRVWHQVEIGHARLAALAIAITTIPILAILVPPGIAIGWVGIESIGVVVAYVAAVAWLRRARPPRGRRRDASGEVIAPVGWSHREGTDVPLRGVLLRFGAAALMILVTAPVAAASAGAIAEETSIGETFIGALLLAVTTSLPELVASIAAVRIGAFDLAVGNLFGSNLFNVNALLAADLFYTPGPVLAAVSSAQVVAGVGAILLMGLALAAVVHGDRTRIQRLEPDAILVLVAYVVLLAAVFGAGG
jgi:cation:H+ antiporter